MFRLTTSFGIDPLDECSVKVDYQHKVCLSTQKDDSIMIKMERDLNDVQNVSNVQEIAYQYPSMFSTNLQKSFLNEKVVKMELEITPNFPSNGLDDNLVETAQKSKKTCPICNKDILSYSFQRHLGTHYGDRYQCPRCR